MRAAQPARAQQSLPDCSAPDFSVSYAPLLSARFLAGNVRGGWWWFDLRACLFFTKSYNTRVRVTQKNACLTLVLFDRTRSTRAAKPCVRQSRHPANSSKWIERISSTPCWFATGYESRFE